MQAAAGPAAQWGTVEHLLATVVDVLQAANWQRAAAGNRKAPPHPMLLPRPTDRRQARHRLTSAETHARLLDLQRRTAARRRG